MAMSLDLVMFTVLLTTLFVCSSDAQSESNPLRNSMNEFSFWRNTTVGSPELFTIDKENQVIILAVKNSLRHISMDLSDTLNIKSTTPQSHEINFCMTDLEILQSQENCQNYHHILVFPDSNDTIDNNTVDVKDTVLICGSNAYQPKCTYRNRTNLNAIEDFIGNQFCPYGQDSSTRAIVTEEGNLVSGSSKDIFSSQFGVSVSHDPFNGTVMIRTIINSNMFKKPEFVDMYDIGNFYYIFMRESAIEVTDDVIYSRVGRMCKNDTGVLDNSQNVFTSFLKARMSCTYDMNSGPDYYYDNLKDTEFIENGTVNTLVMGQHLYGVFSAPVNGPDGSVLCVFTFDGGNNDLDGVFKQKYLEQMGANTWVEVANNDPVTCSNSRSLNDAENYYLMEPTVMQAGTPLIKMDGLLFQRIIIDKMSGINGNVYEVILIVANEEEFLKVLKMTYIQSRTDEDKTHISQETIVASDSDKYETVISMEIYKTENEATVYFSTDEGIYRVPIADCAKYNDCKSCIESQDPYCAYDTSLSTCVNTLSGYTINYIQDLDNGDSSICPVSPTSTTTTVSMSAESTSIPLMSSDTTVMMDTTSIVGCSVSVDISYLTTTSTSVVTETIIVTSSTSRATSSANVDITQSSSSRPTITMTSAQTPISSREPTSENLATKQDNNDLYMMIGIGGACFLVGIAFGIVLFACIRNKDKFIWGKMLSRNRRLNFDSDDEKGTQYEMRSTKLDAYPKNNEYDYIKESTPTRSSTPPLTKLNPTSLPGKVTDSPVLSKYTKTGKTHNRSMSSGGQFPISFSIADPPSRHSPVPETSPVRKNMRNTFHVEEGVSNNERQKYGKNIVSKQLSREYPMSFNDTTLYHNYHSKTNSLDGWSSPTAGK